MPQTEDEKKEKKRLAERRRMENIRKDPGKYALWKLKMKEIYLKRKKEGKIAPVQNLTPKQQKISRKKSRESTRRWYAKKKLKEHDIHLEEEIIYECGPVDNTEINNPLGLELPSFPEVPNIPRSPEIPSSAQVLTQSSPLSARSTRSTIRQKRILGIDLNLTENKTDVLSNIDVPSIKSPSSNTWISDSLRTPSPQSIIVSFPQRVVSPKVNRKATQETSVEKKSPWKHILRKFQNRHNKELQLKDQKILELKRVNENYRKKIKRLQKDKWVTDVPKRQKENISRNEKIQLVVEPCATGIKENVAMFFEEDENSRMCAGKKEFVTKAHHIMTTLGTSLLASKDMDQEQTIQLIQLYRQHRLLWDKKHPHHLMSQMRTEAWIKIASEYKWPISVVKKKMQSLLGSHRRELHRERKSRIRAATTGNKHVYSSKWFGYPYFEFMRNKNKQIKTRHTKSDDSQLSPETAKEDSNETSSELQQQDTSERIEQVMILSPRQPSLKQIRRSQRLVQDETGSESEEQSHSSHFLQNISNITNDPYTSFGNYIASELRKYDPRTLACVKHAINNVIFEADLGNIQIPSDHLAEHPSQPSSSIVTEEIIKYSPATSDDSS